MWLPSCDAAMLRRKTKARARPRMVVLVKRPATREQRADWLHRFCARGIRGMGIEISMEGVFPERGAVISNHLSYLDIVVFATLHPCVFVSKEEVRRWR